MGEFVKADNKNFDGTWKTFMRVQVQVDTTKPIKHKMKLKRASGEWFSVEFKYERLPTFCLLCGIIGHSDHFYSKMLEGLPEGIEKLYGSWLRATSHQTQTRVGQHWLISETPRLREVVSEER